MVMIVLIITCIYLHISSIGTLGPLVLWDARKLQEEAKELKDESGILELRFPTSKE